MKKKFYIFAIFISFNIYAQISDKYLIIKDDETDLVIEDATVLVLKTKQLSLSNAEGKVLLIFIGGSNIQISHTAYLSTVIRSTTLKAGQNIVYLKKNIKVLEEIILSKQHPQKILAGLINNSIKNLTVPARLKVYCREFFKLNGTYSYYNDGLINFQMFGKIKNFSSNILVEQNRSFGLIDEAVSTDLLGYNLNNIIENYYKFEYLKPLLSPFAKKKYDFLIKVYSENNLFNIIQATPIDKANGLLDDFYIIYDPEYKRIIEVSANVSPRAIASTKEKTFVGAKNIYKSNFKTKYANGDNGYYLLSSKEEIGFERNDKKGVKNIEVRNYFVTTNFSIQNYSYTPNEVFKDKTLYNKKNVILSKYWLESGLSPTIEEQNIINQIEDLD
jgi:hypothetical protein